MNKEREALEILKQYLRDNNILFFEGSEKQNCIGFPWIDYIQIPSEGHSKIYETYAIEYCIKNNISLDIAKQALEAQIGNISLKTNRQKSNYMHNNNK